MNYFTLQNKLNEFGLDIFTINDSIKMTGQSRRVAASTLARLAQQNKIFRITKGTYSLKKIDDKFLLSKAHTDTYVGIYSALEYYQTTTQRFNNLDLITKHVLHPQRINDTKIEFHKVNHKMFFGYEKQTIEKTDIFISTIEKTIIDCIYFSSKVYLTDIDEFIGKMKNKINIDILQEYLKRIHSSALNKRIGYLLERHDILLKELPMNNKYEKLNKNLDKKGEKNTKWKLIINEEL